MVSPREFVWFGWLGFCVGENKMRKLCKVVIIKNDYRYRFLLLFRIFKWKLQVSESEKLIFFEFFSCFFFRRMVTVQLGVECFLKEFTEYFWEYKGKWRRRRQGFFHTDSQTENQIKSATATTTIMARDTEQSNFLSRLLVYDHGSPRQGSRAVDHHISSK